MILSSAVRVSILLASIAACFAQSRQRITVKTWKTNYRVDTWDDGRDEPYRVTFWKFGLKSVYLFDVAGHVKSLTTRDTTVFNFDVDVGSRKLQDSSDDAIQEVDVAPSSVIACSTCEVTWNTLCDVGLPEVCFLHENPLAVFNQDAIDSVRRMCSSFGESCKTSAAETCDGQCVTAAPDACNPNPCQNGGSCSIDPAGGNVCSCAPGYGGMACQTDTSSLDTFFIEIDFVGTWTAARTAVVQSAADRWSEVITHVPCGGSADFPAGRLLITATLLAIDGAGGTLGSAGPLSVWSGCRSISVEGDMKFDTADIAGMEADGTFEGFVQREMGHVIGIGTLWGVGFGECSTCRQNDDPAWMCPAAVSAYADIGGSGADIIEVDGPSGRSCTNLAEDIFIDELMTGTIDNPSFLSKMTAAVLDDLEYVVDASAVDAYILPSERDVMISPLPVAVNFNNVAVEAAIKVLDGDGDVLEEITGVTVEF